MIKVTATAKVEHMKPAHKAYIVKHGEGSNLDRAARDAIHNILTDPQFKGLKAKSILPMQITLQEYKEYGDE
ncbi:MAG TPA: hypothetical protein PKC65_10835 [Pyrinomonadaceae bacterium]|nr:hypothetical protein [Pyrinomonadaceae bacterium]